MAASPTPTLSFQNFFEATLTGDITASSTDILLDNVPNGTEGFLVIDPDSEDNREVIYYNSKTATKVVCPSAADGRGQDDTTATSHLTGVTVIGAPVAGELEALQNGRSQALIQLDGNGNEKVEYAATASAVNHPKLSNAITANPPTLEAAGDDTNIDLRLKPKGTGAVEFFGAVLKGILYRRQGGSATVYGTVGNTDYDSSADKLVVQAGSKATSAAAEVTVTFPVAFSQVPLIVATSNTATGASTMAIVVTKSATNFTLRAYSDAGARSAETVNWIAIGPIA